MKYELYTGLYDSTKVGQQLHFCAVQGLNRRYAQGVFTGVLVAFTVVSLAITIIYWCLMQTQENRAQYRP